MAYVSKETKAKLAPKIKEILAKYGQKGTISVDTKSTLVVKMKKTGKLDPFKDRKEERWAKESLTDRYICVNPYWYQEHFTGKTLEFLDELIPAMKVGNWDNSDIQTDYFDVGWYVAVKFGNWDTPYEVIP